MTTDDKLQHFMDISMNTALEQKSTLVDEYKSGIDNQFESFKENKKNKYALQEKVAIENARREFSKDFSLQQQNIRRELTQKKDELKEKLFDEVNELLEDFLSSEDYMKMLIKEIKFSLSFSPLEPITIFIDPMDSDKKDYLEAQTNAELSISAYSFGRGMRAVIPSKNILIDYSFNTKLNEIKDNYTINL